MFVPLVMHLSGNCIASPHLTFFCPVRVIKMITAFRSSAGVTVQNKVTLWSIRTLVSRMDKSSSNSILKQINNNNKKKNKNKKKKKKKKRKKKTESGLEEEEEEEEEEEVEEKRRRKQSQP